MSDGARAPQRSARRRSRELAVQGLYQWLVSREDAGAIEAHLTEAPEFGKADKAHFGELLHGVIRELDQLHEAITPHLDRTLAELSPVEHATLLVGAFELARHPEIPYRVVINEYVELAKKYGASESHRFVNGILDKVAREQRRIEIAG